MFTLALFLALSAKPAFVCVGFTDARCDFTYTSLDRALTDAPDQSLLVAARSDHVWPILMVIDRSYRHDELLMQQVQEMQQKLVDAANAAIRRREYGGEFYSNGCSPKPLYPSGCGLPSPVV